MFNVRVDIGLPGNEIAVNRDKHEDVYVALRDAFSAAKRQREDCVRLLHGEIKSHKPEYIGPVVQLFQLKAMAILGVLLVRHFILIMKILYLSHF